MKSKLLRIFFIVLVISCLMACNLPSAIKESITGAFPGIQDNPVWEEFSIEPTFEVQIIVVPNQFEGSEKEILLKPVRFTNGGTIPYTVQVENYQLPDGSFGTPSGAFTVAFPGGNTSNYLSLPLGTYTWCYYWDVGDVNGDELTDYRHAFDNRPVVLDASDNNQLEFAETVNLAAPPGIGEMEGLCAVMNSTSQPLQTVYPTQSLATKSPVETEESPGTYHAIMGFWNWHGRWVLEIRDGNVIDGYTEGYTWYVEEGTLDQKTLYLSVKRTEPGSDPCNNSFEIWFEFTDEGMEHVQTIGACGQVSTEPQTIPFNITYLGD